MQDNGAQGGFRQGFVLPALAAAEVPAFLAALSPHGADVAATGLLFHVDRATLSMRPFLPHWNAPPHAPQERVIALRSRIGRILEAEFKRAQDLSRIAPQSVDVAPMSDLAGALVTGILQAAEPGGRMTDGGPRLVALVGEAVALAALVSEVIQRTRYPALSVFPGKAGRDLVLAFVDDSSNSGATLDGLRAGLADTLPVLVSVETSAGFVWLPDHLTVPAGRRALVAAMLGGLQVTGALKPGETPLVIREPSGDILWAALPAGLAAAEPAAPVSEVIPQTALRMERLEVMPSEEARRALQARIADARFPLGYRVTLDEIADRTALERDVEILREEIAEREAEIELIRALSAPQMRLMRFSDAQLPALVDALSHLPPAVFKSADLRYAAAHAAGRAEPAHFLMYDPARIAMEGYLREYTWRGRTEDHPIRYWLDPHAAQAMDRDGARILVFAPVGCRLLPAIDSFGGRLGETLRLVLGNLFADASEVMDAPGAEPVFLFSPATLGGADMDVELLDRRWFEPVHLSLKWINDYMVVRAPRVPDREALARLAEDLYEGQVATELLVGAEAAKHRLSQAWAAFEAGVQAEIDAVVRHVATEVDRSAERMRMGRAYLTDAQGRIDKLDALISEMRARVSASLSAADEMGGFADRLAADRYDMVADLLAEIAAGDRAVAEAEARVEAQRDRLNALLDGLQYR
jgi:hypothetical protein